MSSESGLESCHRLSPESSFNNFTNLHLLLLSLFAVGSLMLTYKKWRGKLLYLIFQRQNQLLNYCCAQIVLC